MSTLLRPGQTRKLFIEDKNAEKIFFRFQHRIYLRKDKSVLLDIDDTAGQEEMRALSEVKLNNKDAGSFSTFKITC